MTQINSELVNEIKTDDISSTSNPLNFEANKISSSVLKRLIEEVKYDSQNNISVYNRTHSRHNRGR
ncbi:MAG: YhhA family cyclophane-containing RiPP [Chitinophagaceae bacterium]